MRNCPFFSVITVVLNNVHTLENTIESVLNQSYPNYEYIVVDGGSKDGTLEILGKYGDEIRVLSEPDEGIYDALNKAVNMASGEWLYIIGSDDCFVSPFILQQVYTFIIQQPHNINLISGAIYQTVDGVIVRLRDSPSELNFFNSYKAFTQQNYLVKKEIFKVIGTFDTSFRTAADYEWLLRGVFANKIKYAKISLVLANFDIRGRSSAYEKHLQEVFTVRKKYFGFILTILGHLYLLIKRKYTYSHSQPKTMEVNPLKQRDSKISVTKSIQKKSLFRIMVFGSLGDLFIIIQETL